jgi:hypothetical protein
MGFLDRARDRAEELSKKAKPMAEQLKERATPMAEKVKDKATPFAEKVKDKTEQAAKSAIHTAAEFRQGLHGDDKPVPGDSPDKPDGGA